MTEDQDQYYMRLALKEARKGMGKTSPNPCVGAVIVKDDRVIAKGYHKRAGGPHAEINALRKAGTQARGATVYVTLEPCNHTGRTPPCTRALLAAGVKRVVVGMEDPNPLVHGSGLAFLADHKIQVSSGVLAADCRRINSPFIKHITTSLPWVVMKAGLSLDGRITYKKGCPGGITGPRSLQRVHQLRNIADAIMVGIGTVVIDDPALTTRLLRRQGKDPIRVVVDSRLRIPLAARLLHVHSNAPTWIFCGPEADPEKKEQLIALGALVRTVERDTEGGLDLMQILSILGSHGVTSLLVEGGAAIHGAMLRNRLVDHVHLFYAPIFAGDDGISVVRGLSCAAKEDAIYLEKIRYERLCDDLMVEGDVAYHS
ncbi:MAG: bifunctional diaminohydroxyphosphoribosylaminopyrimidine deaminase/5-amino-6-(5-phosphoribosylamino)uracil reductase RibD [Desulfocapsaceae bacterium]|nr:bifunctional diaminohydroxyphosphoribosylaminopyrimidine deaminase/5-amino-6-(5-phosphoribosylamino)uracil reductase RibD [Desulfocapsaceae bacterium]